MPRQFPELRERLLRAGIAPRHVRRYLAELNDHCADLTAEEQRNGLSRAAAESAALARLGDTESLAHAMMSQPQLRAWSARAPWAALGIAPVLAVAALYAIALAILWTGWHWFLPNATTPFGHQTTGVAYYYFTAGRALYYTAPLLVGWGISVMAARQRIHPGWPAFGLALLAGIGATVGVYASRSTGGANHVAIGLGFHQWYAAMVPALIVFSFIAAPWVAWRLAGAFTASESSIEHSASSR
ncbi:MAG: permease prefix domain 1-containing protein [Acidobacteriaceae bacterium]